MSVWFTHRVGLLSKMYFSVLLIAMLPSFSFGLLEMAVPCDCDLS